MWFRFLGQEDPLEEEMATHSSILAWKIPWTRKPGGLQGVACGAAMGLGLQRLRWERICLQCWRPGFDTWLGKIPWRRSWQPTPVFLPGEFHGQRSLAGYSPWGHKESDMTE